MKFYALCLLAIVSASVASAQTYTVQRLNGGEPIITEAMFTQAGSTRGGNINGPCVIRVPDWVEPEDRPDADARYYMYFAHHGGNYIRMAWAETVTGPWTLHEVSGVGADDLGVFALPQPDDKVIVETNTPGQRIELRDHIASPRVLVDDVNHRFVMFLHGMTGVYETAESTSTSFNGQTTMLTTAGDGLDFNGNLKGIRLGRSYFHVWQHDGRAYAFANDGQLYQSPAGSTISNDAWWQAPAGYDHHHNHVNHPTEDSIWRRLEPGPIRADYAADPDEEIDDPRHFATRLAGDELHVFYSARGDAPESILLSKIDLSSGDWNTWDATWPAELILKPELEWEGANYPVQPSTTGSATGVNQLRDPFIFEDDGRIYLFYTGAGEEAIGVAELTPVPEPAAMGVLGLGGLGLLRRKR
jgi:MYXO-CTERM domain-containing protein